MTEERKNKNWRARMADFSSGYNAAAEAADLARKKAIRNRIENPLVGASNVWTVPILIRTYDSNKEGEALFATEAEILSAHGYQPSLQSAEGSHLHAGRLLLTGGLSVFAGGRGIRSKGKLTVTFQKVAVAQSVDRKCPYCAEMIKRDAKICRYCGRESEAWVLHQGKWWVKRPDGEYWLDESKNEWVRYQASE